MRDRRSIRFNNAPAGLLPAVFAAVFAIAMVAGGPARAQQLPEYQMQPGDQIEISVWGEEQLQKVLVLRPDGKFSFPLAGELNAAGRTPLAIQTEITEKLVAFIPEAVVTVSVTETQGNKVYVIGQVKNPGSFVMNPRINALQALTLAGGATPFASLGDIKIIRGSGPNQRVLAFPYNDIVRGRNLEQNVQLESGDVVVVP